MSVGKSRGARIFLALLLYASLLQGQFLNLVAPGNGADLYFSSERPLKGSDAALQGRVFQIGSEPLTLKLDRPKPVFPPQPPNVWESAWYISDYYSLPRYDTSRDGSVVAVTGERACLGGTGCILVPKEQNVVQGVPGRGVQTFDGTAWLSGNGRYLLSIRVSSFFAPLATIADLETGQQWTSTVWGQPATASRIVADNGTAVFSGSGSVYIMSIDSHALQRVPGDRNTDAVIDSGGQIVLYTASSPPLPRTIRLFNLSTHEDKLFLQAGGDAYAPAISADGKIVTFISTAELTPTKPPIAPQLYAVNLDGTALRTVTSDPDGVLTYTLSDDGQVAWYVSGSGRVVQVLVDTGEAEEKISSTPQRIQLPSAISPGSAMTLPGVAIPTSDVQVRINGLLAPILSLSASMIQLQVPWEVPEHVSTIFEVIATTDSPFDTSFRTNPSTGMWSPDFRQPIHPDGSAVVSPDNPAHPGEVLTFYATGLGPVDLPVPLSRTTSPISCSNATLLYAGLAPGTIGYYQFSVQLPFTANSGLFRLNCTGPTSSNPPYPIFIRDIPVRP